jgi:beta-galactosidase
LNSGFISDVYNGARGISFNSGWKFNMGNVSGAEQPGFNDAGWKNVNVPHDWSIELPFKQSSPAGAGGGYLDGGFGWYRKSFTLPQNYSQKIVTIQFDGVYANSEVWINGTYLGIRPYGYTTYEYNLTPYLKFGSPNIIAVKVNNNQPNSRWYSGSGIYRNVWLTVTNPVNITFCGSFVTTPTVTATNAKISIKTSVQNNFPSGQPGQAVCLVSTIYDKGGKQVVATVTSNTVTIPSGDTNTFSVSINVPNPNLWSVDNPYLYIVKTKVYSNGVMADIFSSTLGLRYYAFNANKGFSLNGKYIKLLGSCMHHDLGSLGAAQNYRALERQVEILKSFGNNAIRTSHNPPAPELLEICDRLGVLVMDEAFDCWNQSKTSKDYSLYFKTWAEKDVQNWVRRDRNHPSIILWSIGNEIPEQSSSNGLVTAKNLLKWIRNNDTTRCITMAGTTSSDVANI